MHHNRGSDGQPTADNTEPFSWIVIIQETLEMIFAAKADVFIAGDLLGYPLRRGDRLVAIPDLQDWCSPRLGIRFDLGRGHLVIYRFSHHPTTDGHAPLCPSYRTHS
jgi:hypothetical protein